MASSPREEVTRTVDLIANVFLPGVANQLRVSAGVFGVVHIDNVAQATRLLVHLLVSIAFDWHVNLLIEPRLLALNDVIHHGGFHLSGR